MAKKYEHPETKLTADEQAIIDKALAVGIRMPVSSKLKPRDEREKHIAAAREWLTHLKRISGIYRAVMDGKVAVRFVADQRHPMNPDDMEMLRMPTAAKAEAPSN
jgi:hypothetical protein